MYVGKVGQSHTAHRMVVVVKWQSRRVIIMSVFVIGYGISHARHPTHGTTYIHRSSSVDLDRRAKMKRMRAAVASFGIELCSPLPLTVTVPKLPTLFS